jgi:hypothetical protein
MAIFIPVFILMPIMGIWAMVPSIFGTVLLLVYRERVRIAFAMEAGVIFDEVVHLEDRTWSEQRDVRYMDPIAPEAAEFEMPEGEWYVYRVMDANGDLILYISPVSFNHSEMMNIKSPTGQEVSVRGRLMTTKIIGSRYDPEAEKVIPVKQVLFSSEMATPQYDHHTFRFDMDILADSEPVVDVYDTIHHDDIKTIGERVKTQMLDTMTLRKESDRQMMASMYDAEKYAVGWASLDVVPPAPETKEPASVGYACHYCAATLKRVDSIEKNGLGWHFKCEYCGSVNRVEGIG